MKWYDLIPPEVFGEEKKVQQGSPIGFTGYGPDGKFQKHNPVALVQTMGGPMTVHEGEGMVQNGNGSISVIPQEKLKQIERQYKVPGMAEGGTFMPTQTDQTGAIGAPLGTPQADINQGIGTLRDIAGGKSAVTESIANRALSSLGGAQTAAIGAAKQEAAQAGYSKQAIGATAQTAMRNMEGERSKLMGDIAQGSQQQMAGAAQSLIGVGQAERGYQDISKDRKWERTLTYTDPSTPEGLKQLQDAYTRLYGTAAPDFNTLKEERDYLRTKRGQDIEQGNLTLEQLRTSVGDQQYKSIVDMINTGATLDQVNARLPAGQKLTQAMYDSMYGTTAKYFWEKSFTRDENRYQTETDYKRNWDAFQATAQYGTAEDAAAAYKLATGKDITPEAIKTMRAMQELQLDSQKISNDAARLQLDTGKMTSLIYMVNQGMSLETINATLGTTIGITEYNDIKEKYKLSVDALKTENLTASTQLQIIKGSMNTTAYNQMQNDIESGITLEEIRKRDYNGDGKPDFPDLDSAVYASVGREREISLATAEYNLSRLKTTTNTANWNTALDMARNGMNAAQIKEATGLTLTDNDVQNMRAYITPDKQWAEALAYNDPTTEAGRTALEEAWKVTHPGQEVPDFTSAAFTTEWNTAKNEAVMQAGKVVDALIGDIVDNTNEDIGAMTDAQMLGSSTVQSALENQTLRQNVFTKLGLSGDVNSPTNRAKIDAYITSSLKNAYKGDVDLLVENYIKAGRIPEEYKDTPDYQGELKRAIQDMLNSGAIDRNGNLVEGAVFDWPWDDPDTRFNYVDWNGNDIVYDANGVNKNSRQAIIIPGKQEAYRSTFNGVEREVNHEDANAMWSTLSETQKQSYFDASGKFNLEGFMEDYFVKTSGQNGGTVPHNLTDINGYFEQNPEALDTIIQNINGTVDASGKVSNQFVSSGYLDTVSKMIAEAGTDTEKLNAAKALSEQQNQFQYYDENGQWQHASTVNNNTLINIWQQFSQMYGKSGEPLTSQEFSRYWNDGKGWIIGEDGIVMNFKESWQKENGVTAENPALSGEAWTNFLKPSTATTSKTITENGKTYKPGDTKTVVDPGTGNTEVYTLQSDGTWKRTSWTQVEYSTGQ